MDRASQHELESLGILDIIEDGAFIFRPDSLRFIYVNEGAVQQTGYSREELLGMTPLDLKLMGMIFSPTGKTALLVDPKGKYKRVKEGGVVNGWVLKELKTDRVIMQQDGEIKELPLLKVKPKLAAGGAPLQLRVQKPC